MKKLIIAALIATTAGAFTANTAQAQVSVHINIGTQPVWGPTGYDNAQYYYLPDADAYYDVNAQMFYFNNGGRWISGRTLPGSYGNFDLYNSYKVVINKPNPWMHADVYRRQYASYRGRHNQPVIRDSRDQRYFANPNHPMHNQWHGGDNHQGPNHGGDNHGGDNHQGDHHDDNGRH